jgi:hypothetical protein
VAKCTWAIEALASALALEARERIGDADAEAALDLRRSEIGGERRHAVLELRQLVGDVRAAAGRGASRGSGRT